MSKYNRYAVRVVGQAVPIKGGWGFEFDLSVPDLRGEQRTIGQPYHWSGPPFATRADAVEELHRAAKAVVDGLEALQRSAGIDDPIRAFDMLSPAEREAFRRTVTEEAAE